MVYTPAAVVSFGFPIDAFTFTYLISGLADEAAVTAASGKVVSQDTAAASTVKLAADGDAIFGRVRTVENRAVLGFKTAAIQRKFKEKVPTAAGYTAPAVGDRLIGGGAGTVKKATANTGAGVPSDPIVVEVFTGFVTAEFF
jgi:hypothetical protein